MSVVSYGAYRGRAEPPTIDGSTSNNTTAVKNVFSYTIPAGSLGPNGFIRFALMIALAQTSGANQTLTATVQLIVGGSSFSSNIQTPNIPTGAPDPRMKFDGIIQNQNDVTSQEGRVELGVVRSAGASTSNIYERLTYFAGAVDTSAADIQLLLKLKMDAADLNFTFAAVFGTAEAVYIP